MSIMNLVNPDLYPPDKNVYLLSHSIGRMPATAQQATQDHFFSHWQSDQQDIWDHWLNSVDDFRQALAGIFNSHASCFCPQSNISSGLGKVIQSLPTRKDKKVILMCESDFPSAGFVIQQAQALGYRLKVLGADTIVQDIDIWDEALSSEIHTVFISHVQYGTGNRAPVADICELARGRNINSIVDIAQSAGIVPIDLKRWNADVVVGSSIKWLCGGPGAGYLWIHPDFVQQLEPADVGWFSHANPFEFDINNFEYAADSARFWGGTPSVIPYVIAAHSINMINSISVDTVQKHNQSLINKLTHSIDPEFMVSPKADQLRGGTLVVNPGSREQIEKNLDEAKIMYDARSLGLRFSPHIYNTEEHMQLVLDCFDV